MSVRKVKFFAALVRSNVTLSPSARSRQALSKDDWLLLRQAFNEISVERFA